jgi:plasmid stabilization system protein ParE
MKVIFTKVAQEQYNEIIYYLNTGFGKEKALQFSESFKQNIIQVKKFPESCPFFFETTKRKFMVSPYITVIYEVNTTMKRIEILNFWYNRYNPDVLLQHL